MSLSKKKVLLLSTHDSHLKGHAWSCKESYDKTKYEVDLVSLYSLYNDKSHAIIKNFFLYRILNKPISLIDELFIRKNTKYCYAKVLSFPVTAKQILKKYTLGKPDIIVLHWYDGFVTPKIIKELYNITLAKIVFVFTDEFSLGGGCHYPCDCDGFKKGCMDCPALKRFKFIATRKFKKKIDLLQSIPKYIIAPSSGLLKAKSSTIFRTNTTYLRSFRGCKINNIPSFIDSRKNFNINEDVFVIMFGAVNVNDERKGFKYFLEALNIISTKVDNKILVLIVGEITSSLKTYYNIEYLFLGTIPFDKLCEAYVVSNIFISPSIADSGPMMLKFSIACGTPVVAFPVGYALDFIKHKETGFLVNNISSKGLAEGMLFFYQHRENRKKFTESCISLNNESLKNGSVYNNL